MSEKPIVATWLVLDSSSVASYYPSTGYKSSDHPNVHKIYWRCVACFFATAFRTFGKHCELVFYTSAEVIPSDILALLTECKVSVEKVGIDHLPPAGYWGAWRNQFYILDIIRHIARSGPRDTLVLDSDCLIVSNISQFFVELERDGVLTYDMEWPESSVMNGLSRLEMKDLFGELLGKEVMEVPPYYGGEIFCATAREIVRLDGEIDDLWGECLRRAEAGLPKLNEEAHFLSFLYWKFGYKKGGANAFIRRIWTQFRNPDVRLQDVQLPIWHVPAEKRHGLKDLSSLVMDRDSWLWTMPLDEQWRKRMAALVGIPRMGSWKRMKDLSRAVKNKIATTLSSEWRRYSSYRGLTGSSTPASTRR